MNFSNLKYLITALPFFMGVAAQAPPFSEVGTIHNAATGLYLTSLTPNVDNSMVTVAPHSGASTQLWIAESFGGTILSTTGNGVLLIGLNSNRTEFVATVNSQQFNFLSFPSVGSGFAICGTGGTTTCLSSPSTSGGQAFGGSLPPVNPEQTWIFTPN